MDAEATAAQRKKALEEKRKRLDELKKLKATTAAAAVLAPIEEVKTDESTIDVDKITTSLANTTFSQPIIEDSIPEVVVAASPPKKSSANLSVVSKVGVVDIYPIIKAEYYDKEVQTDEIAVQIVTEEPASSPQSSSFIRQKSLRQTPSTRPQSLSSPTHDNTMETLFVSATQSGGTVASAAPAIDVAEVISKSSFVDFLTSSSRVIERAISQSNQIDIFKDYRQDHGDSGVQRRLKDSLVSPQSVFDSPATRGRPVMDIHTNSRYPELIFVSYGSRSQGANSRADDPPGLLCVWSLVTPTRPEFVFTASSPVLTARFLDQDAHLIVGACYSGQILLWDLRAKSLPVHRSSLSGSGHKHPVTALSLSSSVTGLEIVSAGSDGLCCQWDVARLTDPLEVFTAPVQSCGLSAVAFGYDESGKFAVAGYGSGSLTRFPYPHRSEDQVMTAVSAHLGLVTSVEIHPSSRQQYRSLVLTSSLDWTVKIWNLSSFKDPLLIFQSPSYDYVSDAKWSPSNPNVFAVVTSGGDIVFFNLSKSLTDHAGRVAMSSLAAGPGALNKLQWSVDGKTLFVGDSKGSMHCLDVQEGIHTASPGDEAKFSLLSLATKTLQ